MKLFFASNIPSHCTSQKLPLPFPIAKPPLRRPPRWPVRMDSSDSSSSSLRRHKDKILVIMGATGCGKSRLSIDLATRYFQSEIINSDKMQVYNGLDITTNKITIQERRGVPHHLLGVCDPDHGELSPSEFRFIAGLRISDIVSSQKLPILAGGSNSFIHALLVDRFRPESDVFDGYDPISPRLRYDCCFLWVDVSLPVLCEYLRRRVDEMLELGMFDELSEYFSSGKSAGQPGLRKAIGVPEFEPYFKEFPPGCGGEWDQIRTRTYEEAVRQIKDNTCQLAKRQIGKLEKLKGAGWDLERVDATAAFQEAMAAAEDGKKKKRRRKKRWMEIWEREVLQPSVKIVKRFLDEI